MYLRAAAIVGLFPKISVPTFHHPPPTPAQAPQPTRSLLYIFFLCDSLLARNLHCAAACTATATATCAPSPSTVAGSDLIVPLPPVTACAPRQSCTIPRPTPRPASPASPACLHRLHAIAVASIITTEQLTAVLNKPFPAQRALEAPARYKSSSCRAVSDAILLELSELAPKTRPQAANFYKRAPVALPAATSSQFHRACPPRQ